MKNFFAGLLLCALTFCMCACDSTATVSSVQSEQTKTVDKSTEFKIGEEIFITNNAGEYKFKITGIEETSERNEFAESVPKRVIIISYDYENISVGSDLYISELNFKAYDKENNLMNSYPASINYPDSISAGRKASGQIAFGLDATGNYVELEYYDNMFFDADCKIILEW